MKFLSPLENASGKGSTPEAISRRRAATFPLIGRPLVGGQKSRETANAFLIRERQLRRGRLQINSRQDTIETTREWITERSARLLCYFDHPSTVPASLHPPREARRASTRVTKRISFLATKAQMTHEALALRRLRSVYRSSDKSRGHGLRYYVAKSSRNLSSRVLAEGYAGSTIFPARIKHSACNRNKRNSH